MTLTIDPPSTALVLIDLQKGIVARPGGPRPGRDVVANAVRLAQAFRTRKSPVVLVHVEYRDPVERVNVPVDSPFPVSPLPPDWSTIVPDLGPEPTDIVVTKRQWGAFYGTDLELQLRRRGVKTIVLGGIATNMGVESTGRNANERGFAIVFAEDAMSSLSAEAHRFAIETIFPRLGRVRSVQAILEVLPPTP